MYSVIHIPVVRESKQHFFFTPDQKYIFMQTDFVSKDDGYKWITENIHDDIDNHWVIKTSAILKFSQKQLENLWCHSNLNLEHRTGFEPA